jgi:hypothetical protein
MGTEARGLYDIRTRVTLSYTTVTERSLRVDNHRAMVSLPSGGIGTRCRDFYTVATRDLTSSPMPRSQPARAALSLFFLP